MSKSKSNHSHLYFQGVSKNVLHILCGTSIKWKVIAIYNLEQSIFWTIVSNVIVVAQKQLQYKTIMKENNLFAGRYSNFGQVKAILSVLENLFYWGKVPASLHYQPPFAITILQIEN